MEKWLSSNLFTKAINHQSERREPDRGENAVRKGRCVAFFAFFSTAPLLKWSAKAADWLNRGESEPDQSQFRKHTLRDSFQLNFARGGTQKR